ncbi:hypothetical protein MKO06_09305 [Gramella sp. GC03-9]|uniref:Uncharacterized protein n=1 Tax=Christiangramia oceanisediminis TaxID=2920386 RepID=A0A9X2I2M5_9FLAO|nr:hypothetical protein [Gramella oceanisediminis]MCP9200104.1 hypothetical protein [Gramella oceanisediminis]
MNSGNTKGAILGHTSTKRQPALTTSPGTNSGNSFKGILQRSKLTEQDLEQFQQSIIEAHRKKNYRVLLITGIIFTFIGSLAYYFLS